MPYQISSISEQDAAAHGIVTDKPRLLRARHWASRISLFSNKAATSVLLGNTRSRFRGRGMEFEEVRRYQAGDDIRTIDWKVTARKPGTYTKLFCEERERPCHIIIDQRGTLFFGSGDRFKSVLAAELGSAIAWATLASGDRVGAQIFGNTTEVDIRARNSRKAVLTLIDNLHSMNTQLLHQSTSTDAEQPLSHYLNESLRIVRPSSAVFVISDFHDIDDACSKALGKLGKRTDLTLIQVFDPLEEALPSGGILPISDGEQTASVRLSSELQSAYENSIATRNKLIRRTAKLTGAHFLKISTLDTARQALSKAYRL